MTVKKIKEYYVIIIMNDFSFFRDQIKITIYLIGYPSEGESIIATVQLDENVVFCAVIDCYTYNNRNKTSEKLDELGLHRIDVLGWTHPDEDHSAGIDELIKFIDANTTIVLPQGFRDIRDQWKKANNSMFTFIKNEFEKRPNAKKRAQVYDVGNGAPIHNQAIKSYRKGTTEYKFSIHAFSPDSYFANHDVFVNNKLQNNDYSLGLWVQLGEATIILAADIPDRVFNGSVIKYNFPKYVDYLKIPHHGSDGSCSVLNLIDSEIFSSCCTVFKASGLPKETVLAEYAKKSRYVFCTNDIKKKQQDYDFGIIKVDIDVTAEELQFSYELEDNAADCFITN